MRLARVTGRVSASAKVGKLAGKRMLIADYIDPEGRVLERASVLTDACGAGPGDLVLVTTGSAARIPEQTGGAFRPMPPRWASSTSCRWERPPSIRTSSRGARSTGD